MNIDSMLTIAEARGVRLDLDRDFSHLPYDEKKREKLERQLTRMRAARDENGRLHPRYTIAKTGRIVAQHPNLLIAPSDAFWSDHTGLIDVSIYNLEVILAAKLRHQLDLAELLLTKDQHFATTLREVVPEFEEHDRQYFKLAMFKGIYGAPPDTPEERRAKKAIDRKYRLLFPVARNKGGRRECDKLIGEIHRTSTKLMLHLAALIEMMPDCAVVGFLPDEPLVEYTGDDPEGTVERVRLLTHDLLRAWSGKPSEPFEILRAV